MNANLLIKALRTLRTNESEKEHLDEIDSAIKELQEVTLLAHTAKDEWLQDVTPMTTASCISVLNMLTYDIYGKIARRNHGEVLLEEYMDACRYELDGVDTMTESQLQYGYDFVGDLWQENENINGNNADGTFNASDLPLHEQVAESTHLIGMLLHDVLGIS